jgi:hypothetical protein
MILLEALRLTSPFPLQSLPLPIFCKPKYSKLAQRTLILSKIHDEQKSFVCEYGAVFPFVVFSHHRSLYYTVKEGEATLKCVLQR